MRVDVSLIVIITTIHLQKVAYTYRVELIAIAAIDHLLIYGVYIRRCSL